VVRGTFITNGKKYTEICALLEYDAALSGSSVPTFRDNLAVPSSRVKKSKKKFLNFLTLDNGVDM
jgi:hypothetical protein